MYAGSLFVARGFPVHISTYLPHVVCLSRRQTRRGQRGVTELLIDDSDCPLHCPAKKHQQTMHNALWDASDVMADDGLHWQLHEASRTEEFSEIALDCPSLAARGMRGLQKVDEWTSTRRGLFCLVPPVRRSAPLDLTELGSDRARTIVSVLFPSSSLVHPVMVDQSSGLPHQ